MKFCIISTLYPPNIVGGAEKVTEKLAVALVQAGYEVVVIALHDGVDTKVEVRDGVKVYLLPLDNIYWPFKTDAKPAFLKRAIWHIIDIWNVKAAKRVGQILDAEKPDIVHSNNLTGFSTAVWAESKKRGLKIVHTLHDYSLLCPRGTLTKKGHVCKALCGTCTSVSLPKYFASRMVSEVVGVSHYVAEQHTQRGYFRNAKQRIIHHSCEAPVVIKNNGQSTDKVVTFGFIGRIEQEKGIDILLQATALLPENGWRLRVAGRGYDDYINQLKAKYPSTNIEWLGFVEPNTFYANIDVLIVPSVWPDPFALVIAEAARQNIPVIISDMGGMPKYLEMGVSGIAVPAGDVQRLSQEMSHAMAGAGVMAGEVNNDAVCNTHLSPAAFLGHYLACYHAHS